MIQLEKYFYQVFRTTLRIIVQQSENMNEKTNLIKEIENLTYDNYPTQFKTVETWLHKMMDAYIQFQTYDESVLLALNELSDCFSGDDSQQKPYCVFKSNVRQLIIPERNLINGKSNARIYFKRLTDELLRYKRVRSMILDKHAYVAKTDEYKLNVDEMILLEYMMADYLNKDLVPVMQIKNAHISYEFANPYKTTAKYSNEVKLSEQKIEEQKEERQQKEQKEREPTVEIEDLEKSGQMTDDL